MTAEVISLSDRRHAKSVHIERTLEDAQNAEIDRRLWNIARNLGIDGQGPFNYPPRIGAKGREL